jgi:hypothetical protein
LRAIGRSPFPERKKKKNLLGNPQPIEKRNTADIHSPGENQKIKQGAGRGAFSQQQKCVIFEKKTVKSVVTAAVESGATSSEKGRGGNCEPASPISLHTVP